MIILVGADPEVFVSKGGELVSAHGLVQGTKEMPFPVINGAIQVDGMALEFNISPASSREEFIQYNIDVMEQLRDAVEGYELEVKPVAHFSEEVLKNVPEESLELGCEPDLNAWTGEENPKPDSSVKFRTAAGHIHIGWTNDEDINCPNHRATCFKLVKWLDYILGVPSVKLDPDGAERRKLYGQAGACRIKPYGVEYRVLSNFWLAKPELMGWVYDGVQTAILKMGIDKELGRVYL